MTYFVAWPASPFHVHSTFFVKYLKDLSDMTLFLMKTEANLYILRLVFFFCLFVFTCCAAGCKLEQDIHLFFFFRFLSLALRDASFLLCRHTKT